MLPLEPAYDQQAPDAAAMYVLPGGALSAEDSQTHARVVVPPFAVALIADRLLTKR